MNDLTHFSPYLDSYADSEYIRIQCVHTVQGKGERIAAHNLLANYSVDSKESPFSSGL